MVGRSLWWGEEDAQVGHYPVAVDHLPRDGVFIVVDERAEGMGRPPEVEQVGVAAVAEDFELELWGEEVKIC